MTYNSLHITHVRHETHAHTYEDTYITRVHAPRRVRELFSRRECAAGKKEMKRDRKMLGTASAQHSGRESRRRLDDVFSSLTPRDPRP